MERTLSGAVGIIIREPMPQPVTSRVILQGIGGQMQTSRTRANHIAGLRYLSFYVFVGRGVHRANGCGPLAAVSCENHDNTRFLRASVR